MNCACFIDLGAAKLDFESFSLLLAEVGGKYEQVKFYGYNAKKNGDFNQYVRQTGAEVALPLHNRKKVRVDIRQVVDSVACACKNPNIDAILLVCAEVDALPMISAIKAQGKKAICLAIENGYALGKNLDNIAKFRDMGVQYITLCHNDDNDICDSARGKNEWRGLSPFGKEVIREMNRQGVLIDLSHASERSFFQALENSEVPIVATHSSARALCDHPRNLTNEQLKALAERGGVAQVCLYKGFINEDAEKASLSDAIRHINHMVEIMGIDHVGIGSDFDGDGELIGCSATNELINITMRLLKEGYSENDIRKIWGENFLRVLTMAQNHRK